MRHIKLMNKTFFSTVCMSMCIAFTACEAEFYQDEQYRKEIYIVSGENNIFEQQFAFGDDLVGYVSIYAAGTTPLDHEVTVELEEDESLLQSYNQSINGTHYDQYAEKLPEDRYEVDNWSVTLKPSEETPYALFPIRVNIDGLEPEDIYFLPLRIASVSDYMISESKRTCLLRILMQNDYAYYRASNDQTHYSMNGTKIKVAEGTWEPLEFDNEGNANYTAIYATKAVAPVTRYGIRMLPESAITTDRAELRKQGIVVTVHPDELIDVSVMGSDGLPTGETIKCQRVTLDNWYDMDGCISVNNIDENPSYYNPDTQQFTLNYRYKYNSNDWYELHEVMTLMTVTGN